MTWCGPSLIKFKIKSTTNVAFLFFPSKQLVLNCNTTTAPVNGFLQPSTGRPLCLSPIQSLQRSSSGQARLKPTVIARIMSSASPNPVINLEPLFKRKKKLSLIRRVFVLWNVIKEAQRTNYQTRSLFVTEICVNAQRIKSLDIIINKALQQPRKQYLPGMLFAKDDNVKRFYSKRCKGLSIDRFVDALDESKIMRMLVRMNKLSSISDIHEQTRQQDLHQATGQ